MTVYEIEDGRGELAYVAFSYAMGLHGAEFRAGTLDAVALLCQHSLDMSEEGQGLLMKALAEILDEALE